MKTSARPVISLVLFACVFAGCGGGTSGTGGFTTGLDKTRELRTLTPADVDAICTKYGAYAKKIFSGPVLCPAFSRLVAESNHEQDPSIDVTLQCRELDDECRQTIEADEAIECSLSKILGDCPIDVDTLETCYNDTFGQLEDGFNQLTCESDRNKQVETTVLEILSKGIAQSPACDRFVTLCPDGLKKINEE